ncbi:MAG: AraC family transcriptional regulator [Defluviitaleaceae bacterium]|nr:AraC family transcriptional regulator [Defluviitaleaceae bacterium]
MDWIERLNKAIVYMEEHMTEEIDYAQLAKIAFCSTYHFQRMFAYIANVPLPEYIRRRKMSLAAVDLQSGEQKIIDTALKYGYSSPTAFNRAFQSVHGIPPSRAKEEGVSLKSYPKITFKLIAKGVEEMEFRIEKHDAIRVVGVSAPLSKDVAKAYEEGTALWVKVLFEGAEENEHGNGKICSELNAAVNVRLPDGSLPKYNGFFGIETEHNDGGEYIIAVASSMPENDSLKEYTLPAHTWAIFSGKNFFEDEESADSFIQYEERLYSEWLPTSGYEIADSISVHFLLPTNDLENAPFEIWVPVRKAVGI